MGCGGSKPQPEKEKLAREESAPQPAEEAAVTPSGSDDAREETVHNPDDHNAPEAKAVGFTLTQNSCFAHYFVAKLCVIQHCIVEVPYDYYRVTES
jgi:hypothetical protein